MAIGNRQSRLFPNKLHMTISHKIINEQIFMSFPYELKDTFRTLFKTAKWNPTHKAFVAANTPQNHNKWRKFVQAAEITNQLLAQKNHEEASEKELQELANAVTRVAENIRYEIKHTQERMVDLQRETAQAKAQTAELESYRNEVDEKLNRLLQEHEEAKQKRDAVIAPVLKLYEEHDAEGLLKKYATAAMRGYSGKSMLMHAEELFSKLVRDMRRIGFCVDAFDNLLSISLNRADKLKDASSLARQNMYSGIQYLKISEEE